MIETVVLVLQFGVQRGAATRRSRACVGPSVPVERAPARCWTGSYKSVTNCATV